MLATEFSRAIWPRENAVQQKGKQTTMLALFLA